ncbi:MAG TPA: ABC transporter ATP-binding protein [Candidatus Aphodomonas merdavium]|nr:ABC transporter ATP-binding protein [Candidatus Aphodomonas merdavium]
MENAEKILEVKNLSTSFYTEEGIVPAVDDLSFSLHEHEILAIVGESGCGKSVTSLSIMQLIPCPPGKVEKGEILFEGTDLLKLSKEKMRDIRGDRISMIFQEPMTSLNPVFTIGHQLMDVFIVHRKMTRRQAREAAIEMLRTVRIPAPEKVVDYYPNQLSGGMRQRVMIAMALSCQPKILIADEPTTALDVTIQAQIIRLISELKEKMNSSVILITHDLGIVAQIAQNVLVMYAGQEVEYADVHSLYKNPCHPYTLGLLKSIPSVTADVERLYSIEGSVPSPSEFGVGCRFRMRCQYATERCEREMPELYDVGGGHRVRCFRCEKGEASQG